MITISIIIVNWNTKELINKCINSINAHAGDVSCEIIVVDNNSSDGSSGFIKEKFPSVRLIENIENKGFAYACNQAASTACGKYLLLLNPDTLLHAGTLRGLVDFIGTNSWVGAVGPKIVTEKGGVENSVRRFPSMLELLIKDTILGKVLPWIKIRKLMPMLSANTASVVDQISGAAFFVKRDIWKELQGMDTRFFMFYEEVDLCRRIKEVLGYNVFYYPKVTITHAGGGSRHKDRAVTLFYYLRSMFLYFGRYKPKWLISLFKVFYKLFYLIDLGFEIITKHNKTYKFQTNKEFLKRYLVKFIITI